MTILEHLTKEAALSKEDKYLLGKVIRSGAIGATAGGLGTKFFMGSKGNAAKGALIGAGLASLLSGGKALMEQNKEEKKKK